MEQQTTRESTPRGHFDSFASFLESKKAIPLRIVILLLWLAAFAFGGMAQGKISSVAESDPSFFLPASAESTLASEEQLSSGKIQRFLRLLLWHFLIRAHLSGKN